MEGASESSDRGSSSKRPRASAGNVNSSAGRKRPRRAAATTSTTASHQESIPNTETTPEPLPAFVTRYKAWRRAGAPHDPLCFVCSQPGDILPCDTCRRAYHRACDPSRNPMPSPDRWYCPSCVDRGWHLHPPTLTPPSSPGPAHSVPPRMPSSTPAAGAPETAAVPIDTAQSSSRPKPPTSASAAGRKSRFNTLPEDVDAALWVVYRELEGVPLLRQRVADLESEVARLRQDNSIQRNELALSRGLAERARVLDRELQSLRSGAADRQAVSEEMEALKNRNAELQAERDELRGQLESNRLTLQEWKQKLASLLGD